jgi:glutathione S-transferase
MLIVDWVFMPRRVTQKRNWRLLQRVLLFASHSGLDYWGHIINIYNGDALEEDYMKLNPRGSVPTLVDHRIALTDAKTIVR